MRTAEPLMVVVPHGVALEVEANVLNRDIGFVEGGDQRRDDQESRAGTGGYAELDRPPQSLDDTLPRRQSNGTRTLSPPAHSKSGSRPEPHVHLRLEGVGKRFGSVVALDGVDLDVRHGEFFCLLGASAAGKTTTLRVISGLEAPDGGRVVFDGEDVAGVPSPDRGIAMVFQTFALYPHLTVFENIAYPLREARVARAEIKARVGEMAEMLRIGHVLERKPETASGGEQQRIAIGRALIRRPRLLLLDEPLTNLDAKLRHDMRAEFKRLHRELGTTMLYATPDELEALGMGERLGVLRDGRIVQTGSPDELYEHPMNTYVGQMVGSPKMNLAPAERGDGASVATSFTDLSGGTLGGPPRRSSARRGAAPRLPAQRHPARRRRAPGAEVPGPRTLDRAARRRDGARPRHRGAHVQDGAPGERSGALPRRRSVRRGARRGTHPSLRPRHRSGAPARHRSGAPARHRSGAPARPGGARHDGLLVNHQQPRRGETIVKTLKTLVGAFASAALLGSALAVKPAFGADIVLRMAVPDWPPTRTMKDLADKHYKAPSGNNVVLEPDFIPWPDYYTRLAASLTSGEQKYQMAVSDSQWLGANIEGGYYMKLNDFIDADPELQAVFKDLHPTLVSSYSTYPHIGAAELAEVGFPHPDANYYGFPQMPDVIIVYYRSDVFCDEGEQAAFKEKYGKDLPCSPEAMNDVDWDMVANFGEFFGRKSGEMLAGETLDDDFYGIAYQAGKGYDFSSMEINGFVWQHGGSIWDETMAPEGQAEGVVNSPEAVKGLEHYLSMLQYMPPVVQTGTMDVFKVDELFREGKVAYILQWIGFGESAISAETSKVHDRVGFAMHPGLRMPDGTINRTANIGGQPFVLTTWNSDEVIREAVDFVKWWLSTPVQTMFAQAGGQSGLISVHTGPDYASFRPWNHAFGPSLQWQRDVWHIPEFFELLVQQQEEFDKAITGQQGAKEALDAIAAFQQELLTEAGHIE